MWGFVAGLVAVSTVVRAWVGLRVPSPWIAADEMIYAELGRSLWENGTLDILGRDVPFYSLVHPALIGLPLAVSTDVGYDVARVLQALMMSLTAVPVFLWGRRLMAERWALVAAALTLTLPAFVYTGLLMTETVFLPVMTLAAWAASEALARPTGRTHALLAGAFVLAVLTRLQALVLVPAFVLALLVYAFFTRDRAPLRRAAPIAGALAVLAALWLAVAGFGSYAPVGNANYDVTRAIRFVLYHVADTLLLVAIAPGCALALLVIAAARRRLEPRDNSSLDDVRAYLAVTLALCAGVIAEVGLFASRYVGRLAERDLLALAPLLFLAFCVWLDRGAPRTRVAAGAVALVAAAFVVLLPYGRLVHRGALQDAFMLQPLWELGSYDVVVGTAVAVVALLFVVCPRVLPVVLAAVLVVISVETSRFVERQATAQRVSFFGGDPAWIDTAGPSGGVTYFYDGEPHWNAVWAHVFWNRTLATVVNFSDVRVPAMPEQRVRAAPSGELGVETEYVVGSTAFTFVGQPLAENRQQGLIQRGLALWRIERPARVSTVQEGVQASGDIYGPASLTAYGCEGGAFQLTLVAKGAPVAVELRRAGSTYTTLQLAAEQVWNGDVPAVPSEGTCRLDLIPSGLVGSTRFQFARS